MNFSGRYSYLTFILIFKFLLASGQDVGFSQFYSNPLYLNPAFTGTLDVPRINFQYRDQWQSLPNAYVTQSASFDFPAKALAGGIGFNFIRDAQANNLMNSYQMDLIYSSFIKLSRTLFFSGALQAGYHQNYLDWNSLVFADNVDIYDGRHTTTAETPVSWERYRYFDFASGVLVFNEDLFAGLAVHHLAQPSQTWYSGTDKSVVLSRKYTLHFGTRLPIHIYGHWRKTFDLSPQLILIQQGSYRQFNYGLLADYKGFTSGLWFRQDLGFKYDALIFLVGYMKKRWHFTYSYDFTVSGLGARSGGTSEISLGFLLKDFTRNTAFPFYRPYKDYIGQ